jgi:hypothetical protein
MIPVLGYTPLIDPLPVHDQWYLLIIPIAILIAVGYKSVRCTDMKDYAREVFIFTMQILLGLGALAVLTTIVINFMIPLLAPVP